MNPKKKPDYDPEVLQSLMDAAVKIYTEKKSLCPVADELELNVIKVRKLLITAGVYESNITGRIGKLKKRGEDNPRNHVHSASVQSIRQLISAVYENPI